MRIAIVAAEASGDQLGAGLVQALKRYYPDAEFLGVAGPRMQAAGVRSLVPLESLCVMGVIEVLKNIKGLYTIRRDLLKALKEWQPDLYIGIDAPDFNLGIEHALKHLGVKVVHYVSPSIWAWRQGRLATIQESTDLILCLLPFEKRMYDEVNHPAIFVGHPLASKITSGGDIQQAKLNLGFDPSYPCLAILPGSRVAECERLIGPFLETALLCKKAVPRCQFVLPLASPKLKSLFDTYQDKLDLLNLRFVDNLADAVMACDASLVASGTATLEVMLYEKPMVIAYKMHPLTASIAKWVVKTPFFGLPNIIARKSLVPEYFQNRVQPKDMARDLIPWLKGKKDLNLLQEFKLYHGDLRRNSDEISALAIKHLIEASH